MLNLLAATVSIVDKELATWTFKLAIGQLESLTHA